jgi:hypothetical protein
LASSSPDGCATLCPHERRSSTDGQARRNAAPHGSNEHKAAIELIGRIEIEIARIERAMDPPRG